MGDVVLRHAMTHSKFPLDLVGGIVSFSSPKGSMPVNYNDQIHEIIKGGQTPLDVLFFQRNGDQFEHLKKRDERLS
jgi:hypothetical protein